MASTLTVRSIQDVADEATATTTVAAISPPSGWTIFTSQYLSSSPGSAGAGKLVVIYRYFPTDEADALAAIATLEASFSAAEATTSKQYGRRV